LEKPRIILKNAASAETDDREGALPCGVLLWANLAAKRIAWKRGVFHERRLSREVLADRGNAA
jgi:hypothetical protein